MIENIADVLDGALINLGLKKSIEKQKALIYWEKAVGGKIAGNTQAIKIKKQTLYVNTSSSVWAQELSLMKNQLIKKLNSCLGEEAIHDIRFAGRGTKHKEKAKDEELDNISKVNLNKTELDLVNKTISDLENEEIRTKLLKIMVADKKYKKYQETEKRKQKER